MKNVHIIGAGLIGGSIALALADRGWNVSIEDRNTSLTEIALLNLSLESHAIDPFEVDLVVVAVPVFENLSTISRALSEYPKATVIDIASVKNNSLPEGESFNSNFDRFVSTHPFAGKEVQGSENSSVDLFLNRVWAICLHPRNVSAAAIADAEELIRNCGAIPVRLQMDQHDQIVGLTSHLPQILSTLLSGQLDVIDDDALTLSGNGLRDMTRLANSSPELWTDIVLNNSDNLLQILRKFEKDIKQFEEALENRDSEKILSHFVKGNTQKRRLPGKHGDATQDYDKIEIQILDKPGELARLFALAHEQNINIEDVRINHALGRNLAILEVYILPTVTKIFIDALISGGWQIRGDVRKFSL